MGLVIPTKSQLCTFALIFKKSLKIFKIFNIKSRNKSDILSAFADWYHSEVFLKLDHDVHPTDWKKNWKIVEHMQESLKCCGIDGSSDFQEMGIFKAVNDAEKLRATGLETVQAKSGEIQRPVYYELGCHK